VILHDLKDRIFRMTNDQYHDTFHMRDLINSALTMLSNEARIEGVQSYSVTSGTANYTLPVRYKSPRALVEGSVDNPLQIFDLVTIDDVNFGYAIWGGEIILKPNPTADKTLNFYYYKYATLLQNDMDESDPEFDGYEDVVSSYAAAMILSLPGNSDQSKYLIDRYFATWDAGKRRFKTDLAKQNKQATVRKVNMW
jgi:hypothetical protein